MSLKAYAPHVTLGSKPLSTGAAQELIANYLNESESNSYLHPDAILTASNVQYPLSGGPQGGVTMHDLRRVEAGLRGEVLKPEVPDVSDDMVLDEMIDDTKKRMQADQEQQEDGIEVGEIGQRTTAVVEGGDIPEVVEEGGGKALGKSKTDKEARKKAKKERERQQKLEREAKRKTHSEA
ncbi:uncharacterized protein BKCO1_3800053 [Diplodia corticola]|uniref:Uncharacterized protein n=1 Tax=Diplodia corticola TaxID=236234 RepID=A0A1J9RX11_9PEZI|nr:uncharacterized protein BKCO1_3800053 [Diplodia corticola]OJD32380.1 hypothetical protein BKCO1_3800053 [Diplodia corticola]